MLGDMVPRTSKHTYLHTHSHICNIVICAMNGSSPGGHPAADRICRPADTLLGSYMSLITILMLQEMEAMVEDVRQQLHAERKRRKALESWMRSELKSRVIEIPSW